jgi:hypothetical protein
MIISMKASKSLFFLNLFFVFLGCSKDIHALGVYLPDRGLKRQHQLLYIAYLMILVPAKNFRIALSIT